MNNSILKANINLNYTIVFTVKEIKTAHSKVKSGADFPSYIKELKQLGVIYYETFVSNGRNDYYGENGFNVSSSDKYDPLAIADNCSIELFKSGLKDHQQGKTDYMTFIEMCATNGVFKWVVCLKEMTCTYFDKGNKEVLVERIPG